ncbi:3-hydroxyisobutyrate dehydrogenase [Paenibacillus endophyticus]|uniref:3-hydroxyisobutyrate dehydrogenase n=1 Tax=Paenibacillus endophyticus TaxID=1294268 RepID=A0A7W5CBX4_9BACL|nr:NAD(P)-dependent oxidoreductase [Paenibacillus endophyticus]MBB3154873.1 3-hydroxyisobutyrate dehydrogenase [Paenibacillus endophyticus]
MTEQAVNQESVIGFIGTGIMGASMAGHLLEAGYRVNVYNRTKSRADGLVTKGAVWNESPKAVAEQSDIILTMLGYPADVEEVYLGESGLLRQARPNAVLIDMTTSSPSLAKRLELEALSKGLRVLDAPVSGGDVGAKEARLSIMVGGAAETFEAVLPLFERMGKNIVHQGGAGSGQFTKMCNQIAIASNMIGVSEALAYAKRSGLDPNKVLKSIETGAAGSWSLSNLGPRIIKGDFAPGFYVKHFIKDIKIAIESAEEMGLTLPGLALARSLYEQAIEQGNENNGTQALYKVIFKEE